MFHEFFIFYRIGHDRIKTKNKKKMKRMISYTNSIYDIQIPGSNNNNSSSDYKHIPIRAFIFEGRIHCSRIFTADWKLSPRDYRHPSSFVIMRIYLEHGVCIKYRLNHQQHCTTGGAHINLLRIVFKYRILHVFYLFFIPVHLFIFHFI